MIFLPFEDWQESFSPKKMDIWIRPDSLFNLMISNGLDNLQLTQEKEKTQCSTGCLKKFLECNVQHKKHSLRDFLLHIRT